MSPIVLNRALSPRERERISKEIEDRQRTLRGELVIPRNPNLKPGQSEGISERRAGRYAQFMNKEFREDPRLIQHQLKRLERVRQNGSPQTFNRKEKGQLNKRIKELREYLKSNMASQRLMKAGYKDDRFKQAMKAVAVEHTPAFQKAASEYQNIMRHVDPDDPEASNLERLRPKK